MPQTIKKSRILLPLICLLVLHGCSTLGTPRGPSMPSPQAAEDPEPVEKPRIVKVVPETRPEPAEIPVEQSVEVEQSIEKEMTEPGTVILLSGSAAAYREIANHLNRIFEEPSEVHTLTGAEPNDSEIIRLIQTSSDTQVVAVGLRAAQAARKLTGKQVVFCQVVNYSDHDLISENMKGVSAMPSPRKLFEDWKQLSPFLERVLVVSGSGFDDFLTLARDAAAKNGITLVHRVVDNDREFLYTVKRNAEPVQGHWLLADNRVLSVRALKEVMSFNSKEAIQTVVFQQELLDFGGLFYVTPSTLEIGDKVIARFEATHSGSGIGGADILFLDDHIMGINSQVAKQLGLKIPDHMKASIHDR